MSKSVSSQSLINSAAKFMVAHGQSFVFVAVCVIVIIQTCGKKKAEQRVGLAFPFVSAIS
jgi:hypothetical protein